MDFLKVMIQAAPTLSITGVRKMRVVMKNLPTVREMCE